MLFVAPSSLSVVVGARTVFECRPAGKPPRTANHRQQQQTITKTNRNKKTYREELTKSSVRDHHDQPAIRDLQMLFSIMVNASHKPDLN